MNFSLAALLTPEGLIALVTLLALEIVLGIDNIIFISILADKLPEKEKARARQLGIGLAVVSRILLLLSISWVKSLEGTTLFWDLSGKDIILLVGGIFLIGKSTYEIHEKLDTEEMTEERQNRAASTMGGVIAQIVLIDVIFSLDSVITAIGITNVLTVMVLAIVIAAVIMVVAAGKVSDFVKNHPTMKMLALAFVILIGTLLVIEGWNPEFAEEVHLKNYAYFAMAFSFGVELLNLQVRKARRAPVQLHNQPHIQNGIARAEVESKAS